MDNLNGKVRKKHDWKFVIESTCLVTSLHLVQAIEWSKHAQKGSASKNIFLYIKQGSITYSFDVKKVLHFTFSLKICAFCKKIREQNIHILPFVQFSIQKAF